MNQTAYYQPDPVSYDMIQTWCFAPALPWQTQSWQYMTANLATLPHAILFSGQAGTGKRAFAYRFIAWVLCQQKPDKAVASPQACGHCVSCHWLKSGTHPNVMMVPSIVTEPLPSEETGNKKSAKVSEKVKKTAALPDTSPAQRDSALIKIDEVRAIQGFIQQQSQGHRFVVIHQADSMTVAAANALLKTLEEPAQGVMLMLLSDTPARLLPTVRSRLQRVEVSKVTPQQGMIYLQQQFFQGLNPNTDNPTHIGESPHSQIPLSQDQLSQALALSENAPMLAMTMLGSAWYQQRQLWLNSWQALRQQARQPMQASDYWQTTLSLRDFLYLSHLMLHDISRLMLQIQPLQQDINFDKLTPLPTVMAVHTLQQTIEQIGQDRTQHLQEKLCYDRLMAQFAKS